MIALRKGKQRLVALFCVILALCGCGEKSVKPPDNSASVQQKIATPAKKVENATVSGVPAEMEPPPPQKFVYVVEGRRDPFQPLILVKRPVDVQGDQVPMTPLQQFDAQQYKLSAIIIGYGEPMAMVNAPDGKSYILRKGTKVGKSGGKVIRITADTVLVEEFYKDLTDNTLKNIVEIKLPKREGV